MCKLWENADCDTEEWPFGLPQEKNGGEWLVGMLS